jgi:ribonuclease P protein component
MARSLRLRKTEHLRSPLDFRKVYEHRCSVSDRWLIVYGCANQLDYLRLGLSVSKKIGNAVQRNRFRRLYRETFRLMRGNMPTGLDIVLIPRSQEEPTMADLQHSLPDLVNKLSGRVGSKKKNEGERER